MYPVLRFLSTSLKALRAHPLPVDGVCETTFHCMPWDLDMFMEMNNGRVLTLYDLGRFDLSIRTGFAKVLKEKRWGLVVAGSTVRYRKRIRMFNRIRMRSQLATCDERWFYIIQSMWVDGIPVSSILLRTGVTRKGRVIDSVEVLDALDAGSLKIEPSRWVKSWIESEAIRPWPPD